VEQGGYDSCFRMEWSLETYTKVKFSIGIFEVKYSLCRTQDRARILLIMMSNITGLSMRLITIHGRILLDALKLRQRLIASHTINCQGSNPGYDSIIQFNI